MNGIAIGLGLLLWVNASFAAAIEITTLNPRPFGYVVGDTLEQELVLTTQAEQILDEKQFPKSGRINAWLELCNVTVKATTTPAGKTYHVKLHYQLPNAPKEVQVVELPAQRFVFARAKESIELMSTEWPITVGPITPEEVLARDGLEAMRPDVLPKTIDTVRFRDRMIGYCLALSVLLLYWSYRHFGIPFLVRQRRPFTRAYREMDRIARHAKPNANSRAIELIHHALNETAGKSLFIDNVDQFLSHRSVPAGLVAKTQEFFRVSQNEFFAGGEGASRASIVWLLEFCRAWREIERGTA